MEIPKEALPLIQSFLAQMSSAMKISEVLADHNSNDKEITPDDIIGGLVYRLMIPMESSEIETSMNSAKEIIDRIDDSESEEECDQIDDDKTKDYDKIDECYENKKQFNRKVKHPICNCSICSKVRVCLLNYKIHECSDPLADKFKNAINHACEEHKIYI